MSPPFDSLVPDKQFREEIVVSHMTVFRRDRNPPPGWPRVVYQNGRKFRFRSEIERYKTVIAVTGAPTTNLPPRPATRAPVDTCDTRVR